MAFEEDSRWSAVRGQVSLLLGRMCVLVESLLLSGRDGAI